MLLPSFSSFSLDFIPLCWSGFSALVSDGTGLGITARALVGPRLSVQVAIGHGRADVFWLLAASLLRSLRRAAPHVAGVSHRPYKVSNGDFKAQHRQQKPGQREHVEEAIGSLLLAWWHRREGQLSVSRLGPGVVNIDPCFWHPVVLCLHKEGTA